MSDFLSPNSQLLTVHEGRRRYPDWLKKQLPASGIAPAVRAMLDELGLHTVCQSSQCPNEVECFAQRQVTFMVLGDRCTRHCSFCDVDFAKPRAVDAQEPERVAEAVARLGLRHVVLTMVARDDLADGGAEHCAQVIQAVRRRHPQATVEFLVSDFRGRRDAIARVLEARPEIFAHNIETVERLTPVMRHQATYQRSLEVLRIARALTQNSLIKSSFMLGAGETPAEVEQTMRDLHAAGCTHLTIGQYVQPTAAQRPVIEYVLPTTFAAHARTAYAIGFRWVMAGPFVRSSYHAFEALHGPSTSFRMVPSEHSASRDGSAPHEVAAS